MLIFLIACCFFFFLANPNKNSFHPMGNFCTRKLTFSSRKLVLFVKKCHSTFNARHLSPFGMTKKNVLCFSQDFLAFGPFLGFFWPSEGLRPPSGQKNPKNSPQAKKPGCSTKKKFVLPHVDIVLHFTLKYTIKNIQKLSSQKRYWAKILYL